MGDWSKYIGKFPNLNTPSFKNELSKAFYLATLKRKDEIVRSCQYDEGEDPNYMFETLDQAMTPRTKDQPKYTFTGIKKSKDKDTGITVEETCEQPMKKFVTVTVEAKTILIYLINAFYKEIHDYYKANKNVFPDESRLVSELVKFSQQKSENSIIPFVTHCTEVFQIQTIINGGFNSIEKKIVDKVRTYFKDTEDKTPDAKLAITAELFVKFMHVLVVMSTDLLYEKRQAVNMQFLFGILRQISTMGKQHDAGLNQDVFNMMKEFVEANKPKKTGKKEGDDEEEEADQDQEDGEAEDDEAPKKKKPAKKAPAKKTAKKAPAKKAAASKSRGRPPKKTVTEEDEEVQEEEPADAGSDNDIDGALDEVANDEEWQDGAALDD